MFYIKNFYLKKYFYNLKPINEIPYYEFSLEDSEEYYFVRILEKNKINRVIFENYNEKEKNIFLFNIICIVETEDKYYIIYDNNGFTNLKNFILNNNFKENENLNIFYNILEAIGNIQDYDNLDIDINKIYIDKDFNIKIMIDDFENQKNSYNIIDDVYDIDIDELEILDNIPNDDKWDILNLGLIFYYILHKKNLFINKNDNEINEILKYSSYDLNPNLNKKIIKILDSLLSYRVSSRPNIKKLLKKSIFDRFKKTNFQILNNNNYTNTQSELLIIWENENINENLVKRNLSNTTQELSCDFFDQNYEIN